MVWIKAYEDGTDDGEWYLMAEFTNKEDAEKLRKAQDLNGDGKSSHMLEGMVFESIEEFLKYSEENGGIDLMGWSDAEKNSG